MWHASFTRLSWTERTPLVARVLYLVLVYTWFWLKRIRYNWRWHLTNEYIYPPPLLSELSESQESGNYQDNTSISVSECTRLARPAIQQESGLPYDICCILLILIIVSNSSCVGSIQGSHRRKYLLVVLCFFFENWIYIAKKTRANDFVFLRTAVPFGHKPLKFQVVCLLTLNRRAKFTELRIGHVTYIVERARRMSVSDEYVCVKQGYN